MYLPNFLLYFSGDPLYVGFDLTIASFDSISEVSMVSYFKFVYTAVCTTLRQDEKYCFWTYFY